MDKIKIPQWIFNIIIAILFGVISVIYSSAIDRVEKVEAKYETLNPVFTQIQTDLAEIKADLKWLKNDKK